MAIGWITVLQSVPWAEVIRNAPKVADGAKKLWGTVRKSRPAPEIPPVEAQNVLSPEAQAIAQLETRVATLDAEAASLQEQMMATSELIQALAEQNAQLVQRAEANRVRMVWLSAAMVTVVFVMVVLGWVVMRQVF